MRKNSLGVPGFTTLVDRLIAPLELNELVKTGVHCEIGRSRFVLSNSVNGPPSWPLVALNVSVLPLMLMLVKCNCGGGAVATTRLSVPPLMASVAVPAAPLPVTVTEDGTAPLIDAPVALVMSA